VKTDIISIIQNDLQPIFEEQRPFPLVISSLGAFPALAKPRVIWAGLERPGQNGDSVGIAVGRYSRTTRF